MLRDLTEEQLRMVENLRRQNTAWKRARWFLMIGGFVLGIAGIVAPRLVAPDLTRIYELFPENPDVRTALALDQLVVYARTCAGYTAFFVIGLVCEILAGLRWKGDPTVTLLLSLIEPESTAESSG